jgi:hypothetical protein
LYLPNAEITLDLEVNEIEVKVSTSLASIVGITGRSHGFEQYKISALSYEVGYSYSRLNAAPASRTRQTGKTQQLERPISQQPVILFNSNFGD